MYNKGFNIFQKCVPLHGNRNNKKSLEKTMMLNAMLILCSVEFSLEPDNLGTHRHVVMNSTEVGVQTEHGCCYRCIELEIQSHELITCCSKSVTECIESTVCGESYLHVADLQFGESDQWYHIETLQNESAWVYLMVTCHFQRLESIYNQKLRLV